MGRHSFESNREYNKSLGNNYAILATQGKHYQEDGFLALLDVLVELRINPIIVVNGSLPAQTLEDMSSRAHRIITRPNFGRDMAAFKEATLYMHDIKLAPDRVLYFNDSLIYLEGPDLRNMVENLLNSKSDIVGATQSFERHHHIGSFIFSISKKAFLDPAMRTFWENYRQYNLRPHCIIKGEIGMSRWMQKRGFLLDVLYNAGIAARKVDSLDYDSLLRSLPVSRKGYRTNFLGFLSTFNELNCPQELIRQSALDYMFGGSMQSQVHTFFGIFYRFLKMPILKKDIIYRGIYDEIELSLILDLPDEQKAMIFKLLNTRGLESEKTGVAMFFKRALMLE